LPEPGVVYAADAAGGDHPVGPSGQGAGTHVARSCTGGIGDCNFRFLFQEGQYRFTVFNRQSVGIYECFICDASLAPIAVEDTGKGAVEATVVRLVGKSLGIGFYGGCHTGPGATTPLYGVTLNR